MNNQYKYNDPLNALIAVPKITMDVIWNCEVPGDVIALYMFYCYTAKWQQTNQPKATTNYSSKGLNWSEPRVRKAKNILKDLKLIEDIRRVNKDTKKFEGWFIKITYLCKTTLPISHSVVEQGTNALSINSKININKLILEGNNISQDIEYFELIKRVALDTNIFPHRLNINKPSKTLINSVNILKDIQSGKYLKYNFKEDWINTQNIKFNRITGITSIQKLEKLIKVGLTRFKDCRDNPEMYPLDKTKIKKVTLPEFLFNRRTGFSWFLSCISQKPTPHKEYRTTQMLQSVKNSLKKVDPDLKQLSEKFYNYNIVKKWNDDDKLKFYCTINDLVKWWENNKDILKTLSDGWGTHCATKKRFLSTVGRFIDINRPKPNPSFIVPNGYNWKDFVYWCRDDLGIELKIPKSKRGELC